MKAKIYYGLFIAYFIAGVLIEDFFLNTIWGFLILLAFVWLGLILIGSAQAILSWIVEVIHKTLKWVFNPEMINSNNFYKLEKSLEENAKWFVGIPYVCLIIYFFYWTNS